MVHRTLGADGSVIRGNTKKLSGGGGPITAEDIVNLTLSVGLTVADLDNITIGMLNDIAIKRLGEDDADAREATQADMLAF
jgi:hypothetical protein